MDDIDTALADLETASKTPAKQRQTLLSSTVDEICEHAFQFGLSNDELRQVVNVITVKSELDQNSTTTLIKNLYPQQKVASDVVTAVVGALGQGKRKPSPATQAGLVKWLSLVLEALESSEVLSQLYSVLFDLLDMITLRMPLCHLLALITRRKHVRPFRIQRLLELCQQTGYEQPLAGLLQVFKNYCPEIIVGSIPSKRSTAFAQSNIEWTKRMVAIQSLHVSVPGNAGTSTSMNGFKVARNGPSLGKQTILPDVHTFNASEGSVTLEEIHGMEDFIEKLDRIDPPSQLVAGLQDPLLQKYLLLNPSTITSRRLDFWLLRYFEEELETLREGFGVSPTLTDVLTATVAYTESLKDIPSCALGFLEAYLPQWDGAVNLGLILDLVAHVSLRNFEGKNPEGLHKTILVHTDRAVLGDAVSPFETLFDFYTQLLNRWIRQLTTEENKVSQEVVRDHQQALIALYGHISTLILSALVAVDTANATILDLLRSAAIAMRDAFSSGSRAVPLIIPPPHILYLLAISPSLNDLDQICALLAVYKQAFENEVKISGHSFQAQVHTFNGYLMDVCNLLWRSQALTSDENWLDSNKSRPKSKVASLGCLCPHLVFEELKEYISKVDGDYSLGAIFGLSHNPCTSALSRSTIQSLEETSGAREGKALRQYHAGPVTPTSLEILRSQGGIDLSWLKFRAAVLEWLEARGVTGIKELMWATMKKDLTSLR